MEDLKIIKYFQHEILKLRFLLTTLNLCSTELFVNLIHIIFIIISSFWFLPWWWACIRLNSNEFLSSFAHSPIILLFLLQMFYLTIIKDLFKVIRSQRITGFTFFSCCLIVLSSSWWMFVKVRFKFLIQIILLDWFLIHITNLLLHLCISQELILYWKLPLLKLVSFI